ncbi:60S acidic ribosomal protein P2 [Balamuthia mandrillaris]
MRIIAAYLLAVLGGNSSPDADAINKILGSVGVEADSEEVDRLLKELDGKDVFELIEKGKGKLASVPTGGAVAAASAPAGGAAPAGAAADKEEKKKDEEEAADGMDSLFGEEDGGGMGLFGDDDDY